MKDLIKKLLREGLMDFDFDVEDHGKIIDKKYKTEDIKLVLYRGLRNLFDNKEHNPELVTHGDDYMLMVDKYPDKLIWFTDNPDFASKYNGWGLIEYVLPVKKHTKIITYEDGHKSNENIYGGEQVESAYGRGLIEVDPYSNSHLYRGIELPDHWYWSYKTQKHIVCDTDLIIPKEDIIINKK